MQLSVKYSDSISTLICVHCIMAIIIYLILYFVKRNQYSFKYQLIRKFFL